jgi:hypothetical protein
MRKRNFFFIQNVTFVVLQYLCFIMTITPLIKLTKCDYDIITSIEINTTEHTKKIYTDEIIL